MKKKCFLFFFIMAMAACDKDETIYVSIFQPGPMEHGMATATKINREWVASAYGQEEDWSEGTVSVIMQTYSEEGFLREMLGFNEVPLKPGIYPLGTTTQDDFNDGILGASYGTLTDDGDVTEDYYYIDVNSLDNKLEVVSVDTVLRKVSGTFTASFILNTPGGQVNPNNPPKMKFSDGMFEVNIIE
jgi:hypothetical protein